MEEELRTWLLLFGWLTTSKSKEHSRWESAQAELDLAHLFLPYFNSTYLTNTAGRLVRNVAVWHGRPRLRRSPDGEKNPRIDTISIPSIDTRHDKRALNTSLFQYLYIGMCGHSIILSYSQGCLLITSGVTLNICVAGFLMIHPRHHPDFIVVSMELLHNFCGYDTPFWPVRQNILSGSTPFFDGIFKFGILSKLVREIRRLMNIWVAGWGQRNISG